MIKLVRVDHRLLHGQVAFSWTMSLDADCILIANDELCQDDLQMTAMRIAKPTGVKLVMKSLADSIAALNSGVTDKYKLFILVKSIEDAHRLATAVEAIQSINLGGMKNAEDKKQISKAVHVNERDVELLKELDARGVKLEIRMVPNDVVQNPLSLI